MSKDQALAGLSKAKKMHKSKKIPVKSSAAKKNMRRQLLEALEQDAMNYVGSCVPLTTNTCSFMNKVLILWLKIPPDDLKAFADLPISQLTKKGQ